jgi:uncharacterized protein YqeY
MQGERSSMASENKGIIVTGGIFNADQVTVGENSTAYKSISTSAAALSQSGREDIAQALEQLVKVLKAYSGEIPSEEEVVAGVQQVAEEINKEKPNKLTLNSLLDGIKNVVDPIAEIAQKVTVLKSAIGLFLAGL